MKYVKTLILAFFITVSLWGEDVLVQLKPNCIPETVLAPYQTDIKQVRCLSAAMNIWQIYLVPGTNRGQFLMQLRTSERVAIAQENFRLERRGQTFPNDYIDWPLHNTGQSGGTADADIDAPEAWSITQGGTNSDGDTIVIAVIDELFDLSSGSVDYWINWQEVAGNGIDDDNNGYIDDRNGWDAFADSAVTPGLGHGHYVASTLGEIGNDSQGSAGLMWRVKVMAVDVFSGYPDVSTLVVAYDYILKQRMLYDATGGQKGAYVVATNNSIGASGDGAIWNALIDTLGVHGILSTGATLNSPDDVEIVGDLPTELPSDYLISVTVSDHNDNRGSTGYGRISIDVAAPSAGGATSFATPFVTGLVGLLHTAACSSFTANYKANPAQGAQRIRELILATAEPKQDLYGKLTTEGRINAHRALRAILNADCGSTNYSPVARLQASSRGVCSGNSVVFGAQTFGTVSGWSWLFESGSPANASVSNPVITYTTSGDYDVTLIVSNASGSDTLILKDYIHVESPLTGGVVVPFKEDFNASSILATTIDPDNDTLRWEAASQLLCDSGAYICRNFDYDRRMRIDDLVFKVDLTTVDSATLTYMYAYGGWSIWARDRMQVIVRVCGAEIVLTDRTGSQLETSSGEASWQGFVPDSCLDWKMETLVLNAFTGNTIELIFRNQNNYGNNVYLDNISVNAIQSSVGLAEMMSVQDIAVFPNPANDWVQLTVAQSGGQFSLIDIQGKVILNGQLSNTITTIPLYTIFPGVYLLRVERGDTVKIQKLMVVR